MTSFLQLYSLALTMFGKSVVSLSTQGDGPSFTSTTFPLPCSFVCHHGYLNLPFACDPDRWLSEVEAINLKEWMRSSRFGSCFTHDPVGTGHALAKRYNIALVMANSVDTTGTANGRCQDGPSYQGRSVAEETFSQSSDVDAIANEKLHDFASRLRWRYSNFREDCTTDVLLLYTREVIMCQNGVKLTLRNENRPVMAVSFSAEVEKIFSNKEYSRKISSFTGTSKLSSDIDTTVTSWMLSIFNKIDAMLEVPSLTAIPLWAKVAFILSTVLIVLCTALGHLLNISGNRLKIFDPNPCLLINFRRKKSRKWRAGFGAGLI